MALACTAACKAEEIHDGDGTTYQPGCDCYVVVRDNPLIHEDTWLQTEPFGESAERNDQDAWAFNRFDLTLSVKGQPKYIRGRNFSPSDETGDGLLHFWPESEGTWDPAEAGGSSNMPWELHGVRLGHYPSELRAWKLRADSTPTASSNPTRFKLRDDVMVVPIQVSLVVPDYDAPKTKKHMLQRYELDFQHVLWDDRWKADRNRFMHPSGLLSQVQGVWDYRTEPSRMNEGKNFREIFPLTLPDTIFTQCNIQFRLVAFGKQYQDREHVELIRQVNGVDDPLCLNEEIKLRMLDLRARALEDPAFDPEVPLVIFNYRVEPECYRAAPTVDLACDPTTSLCSTGWVAFGSVNVDQASDNRDIVLAHELGHALGMPHASDAGCKQEKELMCRYVGAMSSYIPPGDCAAAKAWAKKYMDAYLGNQP